MYEGKKETQRLMLGRALGFWGIALSLASAVWQAWFLPHYHTSVEESDPNGCFWGMLLVPTLFFVPGFALVVIVLGIFGFRLRARALAVIAWIFALLTLVPIIPDLIDFFGS